MFLSKVLERAACVVFYKIRAAERSLIVSRRLKMATALTAEGDLLAWGELR